MRVEFAVICLMKDELLAFLCLTVHLHELYFGYTWLAKLSASQLSELM